MGEERWPKVILREALQGTYTSDWVTEIKRLIPTLGDTQDGIQDKNWRSKVYDRWRACEEENLNSEIAKKNEMRYYSKNKWGIREPHIDGKPESKTFSRLRMGDIGDLADRAAQSRECKCGEQTEDLVKHILTECRKTENVRKDAQVEGFYKVQRRLRYAEEYITTALLRTTRRDIIQNLHGIVSEWVKLVPVGIDG
jgi:hypothetical protein